jgi:hypothetical protein
VAATADVRGESVGEEILRGKQGLSVAGWKDGREVAHGGCVAVVADFLRNWEAIGDSQRIPGRPVRDFGKVYMEASPAWMCKGADMVVSRGNFNS